jgi:DNA-binding response OmpR family regulator
MTTPNFESATALVAASSRAVTAEAESTLNELGFATVSAAGSLAQGQKLLRETAYDLLILDSAWPDGNVNDLLTAVRHGEAGDNPFLGIIIFGADRNAPDVGFIMRHGADDFVALPLAAVTLLKSLEHLIKARLPFVVTSDYVGPDRRAGEGRKSLIPLLDVPNSLRDKTAGSYDAQAVARAVASTMAEINIQKLQRHVEKVGILINRVGPDMMVDGVDEKVRTFLEELIFVADDIARRVKGTHFDGIVASCGRLVSVAKIVHKRTGIPKERELNQLLDAAQAIMKGFAAAALGG